MSKTLEKIGSNAKIAFQNKISNKRKFWSKTQKI